jgi:hypothetical protein
MRTRRTNKSKRSEQAGDLWEDSGGAPGGVRRELAGLPLPLEKAGSESDEISNHVGMNRVSSRENSFSSIIW